MSSLKSAPAQRAARVLDPYMSATSRAPHQDSVKVVVVGETGVGKTALIHRFTDGNFTEDFKATVGADFSSHWVTIGGGFNSPTAAGDPAAVDASALRSSPSASPPPTGGHRVQLHVWDTAGQERYRSLSLSYFKGCEAAIVVYDICSGDSFRRVPYWLEEVLRGIGKSSFEGFPVFVVGNKLDAALANESSRQVSDDQARQFAVSRGLPLMTASAKTGQHVESVFRAVASAALDMRQVVAVERAPSVKLSSSRAAGYVAPRPSPEDGACAC